MSEGVMQPFPSDATLSDDMPINEALRRTCGLTTDTGRRTAALVAESGVV